MKWLCRLIQRHQVDWRVQCLAARADADMLNQTLWEAIGWFDAKDEDQNLEATILRLAASTHTRHVAQRQPYECRRGPSKKGPSQ